MGWLPALLCGVGLSSYLDAKIKLVCVLRICASVWDCRFILLTDNYEKNAFQVMLRSNAPVT